MLKGYKGLEVRLTTGGVPALFSPVYHFRWPEKEEAVSDVSSERELREEYGRGFYTLKSLDDLRKSSYWTGKWPAVIAELILHGKVGHGAQGGYKSERASLSAIMREDYLCDICEKEVGTTLVSRGKEEVPALLCKNCLARLRKALPKAKLREQVIGNMWDILSERYGIPVSKLGELK